MPPIHTGPRRGPGVSEALRFLSTGTPHFIEPCFTYYTSDFEFLQIESFWQSYIKQVHYILIKISTFFF